MKFNIKSKKGFTLIELLVVIGILAVLAAIAIPSVAGLIDRANVSADETNANEMTNAMERFTSEYELYCQDISSGTLDINNLDSAQSRVYNVIKTTTRDGIQSIEKGQNEKTDDVIGIAIYRDTKYPVNAETMKKVIENYTKTSSSTFEPKQSDMHYWYSPDCGVVVFAEPDADIVDDLNSQVQSGQDAKGKPLDDKTQWVNLTDIQTYASKHNLETIPEGAKYISASGNEYTEGMTFPTLKTNDKYYYKEYTYIYSPNDGTSYRPTGWYVYVTSGYRNVSEISSPLGMIRNKPVVKLHQTFQNMTNLKYAPQLPDTVLIMTQTFQGCTSLVYSPDIPDSVTILRQTFFDCKSLRTPPRISKNVEDLYICFAQSGITSLPDLTHCTKITKLQSVFYDCHNIIDASNFIIPNWITDIGSLFNGSQNIQKAPIIPESITDIGSAFAYCPKLSGSITINSTNIEVYGNALKGTKITEILGPCTNKNEILATK